jgi:hypothetical protein
MLCVTPRSLALPLLLALSACPADPTPVDTDGSTTTDPSTTNDPTTNDPTTNDPTTNDPTTNDPTTDDPTTTTEEPTTTTEDPTTTTDPDSSSTDADSSSTHASHGTESESSSTTDTPEESSSSTDAQEESSSDTGPPPDCNAGDGPVFTVVNNGFSDYTINGQNDPTITVVRGCDYTFDVSAAGHPFYIKTVAGAGVGNAYNTGVMNNGTQNGDITWTVADNAPDDLFYNCQFHAAMAGTITVID